MQTQRRNGILGRLGTLFCVVSVAGIMASCEPFFEDLPPCPHGVSLCFETDYDTPDGSGSGLDELVLVVYDADSNWVETRYLGRNELSDGHFRLELDLPEGRYHFIAYSGLMGTAPSFGFVQTPDTGSRMADLQTVLNRDCLTDSLRRHLTDFYWGAMSLTTADLYAGGTLRLMKNTNNFRIMLQIPGVNEVDASRFTFEIIDDNLRLDYRNAVLRGDTAHYQPWVTGTLTFDDNAAEGAGDGTDKAGRAELQQAVEDYTICFAEFSLSRLMRGHGRLLVKNAYSGRPIIDIPLTQYLEQAISENVGGKIQDYLDRESSYSLHFFLTKDGYWIKTYIQVNDWIVRINEVDI